jgi:hypothetical protein
VWRYQSVQDPTNIRFFFDHEVCGMDGSVKLRRAPTYAGNYTPSNPQRMHMHASAVQSATNTTIPWPDGTTLLFWRELLNYSATLSGIELVWELGRDYKAWAELNVQDVSIQESGTVQDPVRFMARQYVHVNGEFHAGSGSEVRLGVTETFQTCEGDWLGLAAPPPDVPVTSKATAEGEVKNGAIELRFLPATQELSIFPNPCTDQVMVAGGLFGPFIVFNSQGAIVHRGNKNTDRFIIDTRSWQPGVFRVRLYSTEGPHNLTITKVR